MMWGIIALLVLAAFAGSVIYLVSRLKKYGFWWKYSSKEISGKKKSFLSLLIIAVLFAVCVIVAGTMNTVIIFIHLVLIMLFCDLVSAVIYKIKGRKSSHYYSGPAAVLITVLYLSFGYYSANHVSRTEYFLEDNDLQGDLKIVQFADAHIGTTFDGNGLKKYISIINDEKPDIVLITGDFIDDTTSEKDMLDACAALDGLETAYGVYFSFGNHDKGYYGHPQGERLIAEMTANGVNVLEDEAVILDDKICIIGRNDVSDNHHGSPRKEIDDYSELNGDYYKIVLDHQPNDYDKESAAGADLVLSGHTHGGQFFPINRAGEWIGANDWTYGYFKKAGTDFIVTSGISDWEFSFKTGCHSEYNVINIKGR